MDKHGTFTFLLTDVESSSSAWRSDADGTNEHMSGLDRALEQVAATNDGTLVKSRGEGDSAFLVFGRASAAVLAAYELQLLLADCSLRVRAALHTGEARVRADDYLGITPNRTARLRSVAHGGQIVVSRVCADIAEPELAGHISLVPLGTYRIRDWPHAELVYGVRGPGIPAEFPPLRVWDGTERALMTVVAVDTVGAHDMVRSITDAEVIDLHRSWDRVIRSSFVAESGRFLKLVGDGCLATFEDPAAAVRFARSLRSALNVRIALHVGVVELVGDDIAGRALYEVTRLLREAAAGEIVASKTLTDLMAGGGPGLEERLCPDERTVVFALP